MKRNLVVGSGSMWNLLAMMFVVLSGCSEARQETSPSQRSATGGIQGESSDKADAAVIALRAEFEHDAAAVQKTLLDANFNGVRDTKAFREAIREAVVQHKISRLILAPPDEPGQWLEIEGQVVDSENNPIPDAVVDAFGTDNQGRYHPTIEGEETPRLFGVLVTNDEGKFWFRTIRPGPYPGTRNAEHFHIWASVPRKHMAVPHYAVLDDDPLLQEPQNAEQRREAVRVQMKDPDQTGVAHGTVVLPMR